MSEGETTGGGRRRRDDTVPGTRQRLSGGVAALRAHWPRGGGPDQPEPAREGTLRGHAWTVVIAVVYYLVSNPLVFIGAFELALGQALGLVLVFVLLQRSTLRSPVVPWTIALFAAFSALSAVWSVSRDDTWSAVRIYALVAVLAVVIASNVRPRVLAQGLVLAGALIFVASYIAHVKALPGADVPVGNTGYMAGVGTNRNILAYSLLPTLCAGLAVLPRTWRGWPVWAPLVFLSGFGIYLAESSTGYVAAAAMVVLALLLRVVPAVRAAFDRGPRLGRTVVGVLGLGAVGAAVAAVTMSGRIVSATGRDGTLSGRVPLWELTFEESRGALLQGYGWGSVWPHPWQVADANDVATQIYQVLLVPYAHGHNSVMDILPQLGIIGVALMLLCYLDVVRRGFGTLWRGYRSADDRDAGLLVLMVVAGLVAFGVTEPMASVPLGWFLLVLTAVVAHTRPPDAP